MDFIYFLAHHFPFWGIPLGLVLLELANSHRKRGHFQQMLVFGSMGMFVMCVVIAFFAFNGFDTAVPAIRRMESRYLN